MIDRCNVQSPTPNIRQYRYRESECVCVCERECVCEENVRMYVRVRVRVYTDGKGGRGNLRSRRWELMNRIATTNQVAVLL